MARTGLFDPAKCASNARAYARDRRVIGVVGTLNSPCSVAALPELARAKGGPLAMVSPVNSYPGLTRPAPGAPAGELESLYPGGRRHFARVYPADDHQAVALAALADELGARRLAVLDDGDILIRPLARRPLCPKRPRARNGDRGAPQLGPWRRKLWTPGGPGGALAARRRLPRRAFSTTGGATVLRALRRALGPEPKILLIDGFTPTSLLLRQAGRAAEGAYLSISGLINESLPPRGRRFAADFGATLPGVEIEPSAVYTAEATQVLLDAIARSDGTRAGVLDELFRTSLRRGLTGSVRFDDRGDIVAPPITILRMGREEDKLPNFPGARVERLVRTPAD